jgi:preprotein translocase subunit SecE
MAAKTKTKVKAKKRVIENSKQQVLKSKGLKIQKENFFNRAVRFLKEVKIEAKKITWPNRKQVLTSTLMVAVLSLFIGGYLGLLDAIYNAIISFLVR